jgi:hypothetical protein
VRKIQHCRRRGLGRQSRAHMEENFLREEEEEEGEEEKKTN